MHNSKAYFDKGILKQWQSGMLTQSQLSQVQFYAKIDHVKTFNSILRAISFAESAVFQISEHGIKVVVEEARTIQAAAYFKNTDNIFSEYRFKSGNSDEDDNIASFSISLKIIVENLNMFSEDQSELKILYKGEGSPLILIIEYEPENITTECSIKTRELQSLLELENDADKNLAQIAFRGPCFHNFLNDAFKAVPGAEDIEFQVAKDGFTTVARGQVETHADYFLDKNSDIVLQFQCSKRLRVKYRCAMLKLLLKTLQMSKTTTLTFDMEGLLGVRVMIEDERQIQSYIEYFVFPLDEREL